MLVKALVSFSGAISMHAGEKREIKDKVILDDLVHAGYVEPIELEEQTKKIKKGKKDEN